MDTIFIQIAAYRDPELLPTIRDCLEKAAHPENLRFCIAWQHDKNDSWDQLDDFIDDDRFHIIDIAHHYSRGTCWARNLIQQRYKGEKYTLQLDSHHRFMQNWDADLVEMLTTLQRKGYSKPIITNYAPQYHPDTGWRHEAVGKMKFDKFTPEGAVFFMPDYPPADAVPPEPIPARFYSAHFCFTLGSFCVDVPHDPNYYFHGEEISIAARAYTHGYDLFHPNKCILFHEYTRKGRRKQWDDDAEWWKFNHYSLWRNRVLFGMEEGDVDFGVYGFGSERSLSDYERYSGLNFKNRSCTQAED